MIKIQDLDGEILAHHTTEHPLSSYGMPVWSIEDDTPKPGKVLWTNEDQRMELTVKGVLGGWLIVAQPDGCLAGIIWSDGNYFAEIIEHRQTCEPATEDTTLQELASGKYKVRGTLCSSAWDQNSPLGCIFR